MISGSAELAIQIIDQMSASFKQMTPNIPVEFWDEFMSELDKEELIELIIPIYEEHFSESDIKELIQFYNSPIGKKLVSELPAISRQAMQAGEAWGEIIAAKALNKIKEKGYE